MKTHICPFCGKKVHGKHLSTCKLIPQGLSEDDVRLQYIQHNTYNGICNDIINDYTNLMSLPDLKKKYDLDYKNIQFILNYHNIELRTLSQSAKTISVAKIRNTCLEKYGVDNPSKYADVQKKKSETFIKHYGVDNVWKTKEYAQFTSDRWNSYSSEKKNELLQKWSRKRGTVSKLELHIIELFKELNIDIVTQFKFKHYYHKYDIQIVNTHILFEINGDFWHANPEKYNEDDILNFGDIIHTAKSIWAKDKANIEYAESQNYIVFTIWETFINEHTDEEIKQYILEVLTSLN